jgi:CopG family nickel-responsive transcriptional regulator
MERVTGHCVAALSYVFSHNARDLSRRLTGRHHDRHDLATIHMHRDRENCLEVAVLRGETAPIREFAMAVIAGRGVSMAVGRDRNGGPIS